MSQNQPGDRTPEEVMHEVVIPAMGNNMPNRGIARLEYTSSPPQLSNHLTVVTNEDERVRLVIDQPPSPMRTITEQDIEDDGFPEGSLGMEIEAETDAWTDLIKGLQLIRTKSSADKVSPFNCNHDELGVMVDPDDLTTWECAQLEEWGFHVGDGYLYSFKYGSA